MLTARATASRARQASRKMPMIVPSVSPSSRLRPQELSVPTEALATVRRVPFVLPSARLAMDQAQPIVSFAVLASTRSTVTVFQPTAMVSVKVRL